MSLKSTKNQQTSYLCAHMIEKKQVDYEKVVLIGVISQHQDEKKSQDFITDRVNNCHLYLI